MGVSEREKGIARRQAKTAKEVFLMGTLDTAD